MVRYLSDGMRRIGSIWSNLRRNGVSRDSSYRQGTSELGQPVEITKSGPGDVGSYGQSSHSPGRGSDELLGIMEASNYLCVHPATLRRWSGNNGVIKAYRSPGGHRRFKRSDVEALRLGICALLPENEKEVSNAQPYETALVDSHDPTQMPNVAAMVDNLKRLGESVQGFGSVIVNISVNIGGQTAYHGQPTHPDSYHLQPVSCADMHLVRSDGQVALPDDITDKFAEYLEAMEKVNGLTPREREVLDLVSHGNSNKMVAHELGISEQTVKNHVTGILSKANVHDRADATRIYTIVDTVRTMLEAAKARDANPDEQPGYQEQPRSPRALGYKQD